MPLWQKTLILLTLGSASTVGSCTCYVSASYCYDYYGYYYGSPYCDYSYMDPWGPASGYGASYYETLEPTSVEHPDPQIEAKRSTAAVNVESYLYLSREIDREDGPTPVVLDEKYPCGAVENGHVSLCVEEDTKARDEDYIVVAYHTERSVELDADNDFLVLTFAFTRDDDAENNYQAPAERAHEYYGGTDKWFVAAYEPQEGWGMDVFESDGTSISSVDSEARIVIQQDTVVLMAPAAEFETERPASRIALFRHGGEEGADGDWDGFVHPPLDAPLIQP